MSVSFELPLLDCVACVAGFQAKQLFLVSVFGDATRRPIETYPEYHFKNRLSDRCKSDIWIGEGLRTGIL